MAGAYVDVGARLLALLERCDDVRRAHRQARRPPLRVQIDDEVLDLVAPQEGCVRRMLVVAVDVDELLDTVAPHVLRVLPRLLPRHRRARIEQAHRADRLACRTLLFDATLGIREV